MDSRLWIIVSHYVNCEMFENYIAVNFDKVYLADGEPFEIVGMSDVRICVPNGSIVN